MDDKMDAPMTTYVNNDNANLFICSQPNLSTTTNTKTLSTNNKNERPNPDSPDNLPATQRPQTRQIRRRNPIGDL